MALDTYALCTVQDVIDYGGDDRINDATDHTLLESLINAVSTSIETYTSNQILSRERTEYHDGTGNKYIYPYYTPITSISGIWDDVSWEWGSSTEIDSSLYRVKNNNTIVLYNTTTTVGDQNIKIIYTAGYATVPYDIKQVCVEEVLRRYKRRSNIDISAISMDDGSISIMSDDLLPRNKMILNKYKRVRVI